MEMERCHSDPFTSCNCNIQHLRSSKTHFVSTIQFPCFTQLRLVAPNNRALYEQPPQLRKEQQ